MKRFFNIIRKRIKGRGNVIRYKYSILRSVSFNIKGDNNFIEIEDGCILSNVRFSVWGNNHHIVIGKGCRFNRGGEIWIEDSGCALRIGANSNFEDVHIALTEHGSKVLIGDDCLFAYDIDVRTGDSHSILEHATGKRINHAKDVIIGKHVWVAAHVVILKGVSIADNSVVATGAVVTKPFSQVGSLIGGNPATIVKNNITWCRERIYDWP